MKTKLAMKELELKALHKEQEVVMLKQEILQGKHVYRFTFALYVASIQIIIFLSRRLQS